jgi:hypothetical protein
MRITAKRIVKISVGLLMLCTANAQDDALAAIQKIYAAYNKAYTISFTGTMKMYAKANPAKIIERIPTRYLIKGHNFYCSIGPVTMLMNDKYYVSADKSVRILIIGNKKDLTAIMQSPVLSLDQFSKWIKEKDIDARIISGNAGQVLHLTDTHRITGYDQYSITYDRATGFMQKVILELSDGNDPIHKTIVIEINYTRPAIAAENKNNFSEKQFFSVQQNKIQLSNSYKGYQLINQL